MIQEGNVIPLIYEPLPRELGKKRVFVNNRTDFYHLINRYNGKCDLYATIYSIPQKRQYGEAVIDKIYFDMDNIQMATETEPNCWLACCDLHQYLLKKDLRHTVLLTGRGFAIFINTKVLKLSNPKAAIGNAQREIAEKVNLTIGKPQKADIDESVIGDVAQISRIPNTWNLRARRFSIPLIGKDFKEDYDDVCMVAEEQRFKIEVYGNKILDLIGFDRLAPPEAIEPVEGIKIPEGTEFELYLKMLPPVIQRLLLTMRDGHRDRYYEILGIREVGIPLDLCYKICEKYWSPQKYAHAVRGHGGHDQIKYIYRRTDLMFPNWDTLEREGCPISKEDRKYRFYKERA